MSLPSYVQYPNVDIGQEGVCFGYIRHFMQLLIQCTILDFGFFLKFVSTLQPCGYCYALPLFQKIGHFSCFMSYFFNFEQGHI